MRVSPHTSILVNKAKCTEKRGQNNLKNQGRHMVVLPIKQKCQFRNNSNPLFTSTCTSSKQVHKSHPEILLQKINSITRTRLQVYLSSLRVPNPSRYNIFGRFGRQPFQPAAAVCRRQGAARPRGSRTRCSFARTQTSSSQSQVRVLP